MIFRDFCTRPVSYFGLNALAVHLRRTVNGGAANIAHVFGKGEVVSKPKPPSLRWVLRDIVHVWVTCLLSTPQNNNDSDALVDLLMSIFRGEMPPPDRY